MEIIHSGLPIFYNEMTNELEFTIKEYTAEEPEIIIAGGALYNAPDIRKAVIEMKEAMKA